MDSVMRDHPKDKAADWSVFINVLGTESTRLAAYPILLRKVNGKLGSTAPVSRGFFPTFRNFDTSILRQLLVNRSSPQLQYIISLNPRYGLLPERNGSQGILSNVNIRVIEKLIRWPIRSYQAVPTERILRKNLSEYNGDIPASDIRDLSFNPYKRIEY